jgi:hypothetical protein
MSTQGYQLSAEAIRQLKKLTREWFAYWKNELPTNLVPGVVRTQRRQAILEADLLAAVDTLTDPSTAPARLLDLTAGGDLELSDETVTVVNRFENISIDADTYVKIEFIDGEWQPYAADCGPQSESLSFGSSSASSGGPSASAGTGGP